MKRLSIAVSAIILLTLFNFRSFGQDLKWSTTPRKGFVFEITNKQAQKLLTTSTPDTIFKGLLYKQIDTFDVRKGWLNRPTKGHFILANIEANKLHCEYTSVFPYQVFLLKEYDAFALQVLDLDGNVRQDAIVKSKLKRLRIDPDSKTYRIESAWFNGDERIVTVELEGFRSIFNIEKHEAPSHYNYGNNDEGPSFYSYMITDKNKYRPNEKIRFKSYALSQSRSPLRRELALWLSNAGKSVRVGKAEQHRPGSYTGEFILHDSLKLTLDRNYNLQLRERNGRIVSSCNFNYEDYELNGDKLEIRLATNKQFHPSKNELSITATDVNGLMLKDGRATVVVTTQTIRETFQRIAILKDTLLLTNIDLDPSNPTLVDISSEIFQKTNTAYEVNVTIRNSQNQLVEQTASAIHYYSQYELVTRFSNDSINYQLLKNGISVSSSPIKLRHDDEKAFEVSLPFKEKINAAISTTYLNGDLVSKQISMRDLIPQLELIGGIDKDSFNIVLQNPQKLDMSWYIYQGSDLLQKGFGNELEFRSAITDRSQNFYVELLYSFGGEEHVKQKEYEFRKDYLNVSLDVPERVYPGQQIDATITVSDQLGYPVSGVDLTAFAVTHKLNYYLPDLPYYGRSSSPRYKKANYSKNNINKRLAILDLDYKRWEKPAGLDTMKYYQFTYPKSKTFKYVFAISDSTQFSPYVMQGGIAKQVFVIEINRKPVYYSWVDQPNRYSFYVPIKDKASITLRLYDSVILFDSISFSQGMKTILSIDLDHLPGNVKIHKIDHPVVKKNRRNILSPFFTPMEIGRHLAYLASFKHVDQNAYLESDKEFTSLFNAQEYSRKESIIVGPITPGKQTFIGTNGLNITYRHDGGYAYTFENNIVYKLNAEQLIPDHLYNSSFNPMTNINDKVVTKKAFLEMRYTFDKKWQPRTLNLVDRTTEVKILLPEEMAASGFSSLLFENCSTKQIISPCQNQNDAKSEFHKIPRGYHNIIALYNNGTYLKIDSINLKTYTKVVIDLNQIPLHPVHPLSRKWQQQASTNCYEGAVSRTVSVRHSGLINGNIRGTVYDDMNMPLPGANIIIKDTENGTATDEDGRFAVNAERSAVTLTVSFIGYMTREIEVQIGSEISVYMAPDISQLQEVVVVGYGTQMRMDIVAALNERISGVEISTAVLEKREVIDNERQEAETKLYAELLELNTIRSHFTDVGFWEPKLYTDKKGQSTFKITFPDDITRWDAIVYAMNRHLQTGTARKIIKSYKPIVAELITPRFLTKGDSTFFLGKVSNYTHEKNITGKIKWSGVQDDLEKDIQFAEFHIEKLPINPVTTDSILSSYVFTRTDGYSDGEQRSVPVVEQGIIRADGTLSILKNKEEVHVKASSKENVIVEILANQIGVYEDEAKYLLNYKYDCNEQLASKLIGLTNYRILMQYEEKSFAYDKDVNKIIARLLKNQNQEFLWSWWDVSQSTSYWMSAHILRALKAAKDSGYKVDINIQNIIRKAEYRFEILHQYTLADVDLLQVLASWGATLNYVKHIKELDSLLLLTQKSVHANNRHFHYPYSLLKQKLMLQEVRQILHLPFQRDSVLHYQKIGILGEIHFSDSSPSNYWYDDELATNVIAYRIVKRDSLLKKLLVPMQMYFLSQRNKGAWNTYHSSNVLMNVLPDLLTEGTSKKHEAIIKLTGKVNATIDKFPYRVELLPQEELQIKKETGLPVYFMQYKKERVTKAKTGVDGFEIKTTLGQNQTIIEAGEPISLIVEVNVKKEASLEYVMIEVPIPGSCSYMDKKQNNGHVETHREYFKDRTVIFCENMKSGKYSFVIQLLPRFTGKFIINPAQISLMYIPVVNANTDMKFVRVN